MPEETYVLEGVHHISLAVRDLERSTNFYSALGFEYIYEYLEPTSRWLRAGRVRLQLRLLEQEPPLTDDPVFSVMASDLTAFAKRTVEIGGTVLGEPVQDELEGHEWLRIRDLDGHIIEARRHVPQLLNQALVERLWGRQLCSDEAIRAAFLDTPRHLFVPGYSLSDAYSDTALLTKKDDTPLSSSSQPLIVALMLEQLQLKAGNQVLEVGAGTGWNAALMGHLVGPQGSIWSVDIDEDTAEDARVHLAAAGVKNVEVVHADGGNGHEPASPYDAVIATVGVWDISPHWIRQLRPGGRLLAPLWMNTMQFSALFEKLPGNAEMLESRSFKNCGFMRMRGQYAGPEATIKGRHLNYQVDDPAKVDTTALERLLENAGRETELPLVPLSALRHFGAYLALTGMPLMLLTSNGSPKFDFQYTYALGDGDGDAGFVILAGKRRSNSTEEWEGPAKVTVYGGNATIERLLATCEVWKAAGCPGLSQAVITVCRNGELPEKPGPAVIRKQWMDYHVRFEVPA